MLKYNINDHMYVQITDEGWLHLLKTVGKEYIDNCIKPYEVEISGEVWHKLQCWSVFDLMPPVFGGKNLFMPGVMIESEGIKAGEVDIMSEHKEETIHDRIKNLLNDYYKVTGIEINSIGIYWGQRGIGEDKAIMYVNIDSTKTRY